MIPMEFAGMRVVALHTMLETTMVPIPWKRRWKRPWKSQEIHTCPAKHVFIIDNKLVGHPATLSAIDWDKYNLESSDVIKGKIGILEPYVTMLMSLSRVKDKIYGPICIPPV